MSSDDDTSVFGGYADFYDALYADKDYEAECAFLEKVFARYGLPADASLLDLGCGTGSHVIPMALRGHDVVGVDRSPEMLAIARAKAAAAGTALAFVEGDVRTVRLDRTFDAVVSMFAVVCYQLTNADLLAMFESARAHLDVGGLLVFDGWFGPAVLLTRPEIKTKTTRAADGGTITRTARPTLDVVAQTVEVAYEVSQRRDDETVATARESHTVRFLFAQEIDHLLWESGFALVAIGPFMDLDRPLTADEWNFSAVAKAV